MRMNELIPDSAPPAGALPGTDRTRPDEAQSTDGRSPARVNDFAFKIATVNGTGSASANGMLLQTIFRMGIPVCGKNVFPSNIQGLPTWYEIRVSRDGYTARTPEIDLMVTMNPATHARDIAEVRSGGWLLHDSSWPLDAALLRPDVTYLGIPLGEMAVENFSTSRERTLMKNILYVGALAALLEIDRSEIERLLAEQFGAKPKLIDVNLRAIEMGYAAARERFDCPLPIRLERMDETAGHILLDGNTAAALGCVYAGATVGAWYPITPATSLMDAFTGFCSRFRTSSDGSKRYAILQAEDELAAAGMVIGAGWSGARAFTPTSGPGISLMSEFIGLAYYAEIPGVFFDIQRTGPSTGMPTRTQQGDLLMVAYASHGDTKHIALFPANPEECFYFAVQAFDLAERFQTPVFVVSDLDIGMNDWMSRKLVWDDSFRPDRGEVLTAKQLAGMERFSRYLDTDGDGVAARTIPGVHPRGAYFARGSGHNKHGAYTEDSADYMEVMERLKQKMETAALAVPEPEIRETAGARIALVSIGGCHAAILEAMDALEADGLPVNYMRVRGFPFSPAILEFLSSQEQVVVVEQNRDAQLRSLLILETGVAPEKLLSLTRYGGIPLSARHVVEGIDHLLSQNRNGVHIEASR
jgi:2-oxoglutarate/2-oxoacid ferredoxin oxidoreductase subunit alpha